MSEELVLVGHGEMFMTAETRDKMLARVPQGEPAAAGGGIGCDLDGLRVTILTEEELREKAKEAERYVPPPHPRAASREATRRRRQAARRAARAAGGADV